MYLCSPIQTIGVWRSWLAHLVWDQRVLCSSHSTPTSSKANVLRMFAFLFMRMKTEPTQNVNYTQLYPLSLPEVYGLKVVRDEDPA